MSLFSNLREDIDAAMERDPAARSRVMIVLAYPGFHALLFYRIARWFWTAGWYLAGRVISHIGRFLTGIEIHPGAQIGPGCFIDHGMGVVIGETAELGRGVTLYQGVTLGGTSLKKGKRHPTLGDGVIVGAGAKVLGPITLAHCARVGSNAVVVKDVGEDMTVVGIPARPVRSRASDAEQFCAYGIAGELPDPLARTLDGMLDTIHSLSSRVEQLESELAERPAAAPAAAAKDAPADFAKETITGE